MKLIGLLATLAYTLLLTALFQGKPLQQSIQDGALIYQDFCLQCHQSKGEGVSGSFPPLAESDYLKNNLTQSIQGVKYGMRGPIVVNGIPYNNLMAAQGLDDEEVADVMNYILNNWGNSAPIPITEAQVRAIERP